MKTWAKCVNWRATRGETVWEAAKSWVVWNVCNESNVSLWWAKALTSQELLHTFLLSTHSWPSPGQTALSINHLQDLLKWVSKQSQSSPSFRCLPHTLEACDSGEECALCNQTSWVRSSTLLLPGFVTLSKLLNFSGPQSLDWKKKR